MTRPEDDGSRTGPAQTARFDDIGGGAGGPRIALVSDIHANVEALETVLRAIEELDPPVDEIVCAGDVVGYNAHPGRAVEIVRDKVHATVMGNHDWAATEGSPDGFNPMGVAGVEHSRDVLDDEARKWIGDLPLRARGTAGGVTLEVVHAAPDSPIHRYVFPPEGPRALRAAAPERRDSAPHVLVVGHTHVPMGFLDPGPADPGDDPDDPAADAGRLRTAKGLATDAGRFGASPGAGADDLGPVGEPEVVGSLTLEGDAAVALVNPGSVGQPRDGDPRASFAVLDTGAREVTWYRVPYDVEAARQAVLDAGLPERIGDRLLEGN